MGEGVPVERARACARLALGNASRARYLASPEGEEVRGEVESFVAAALAGGDDSGEPWRPLLQRAESRREAEEERLAVAARDRLELEPKGRERRAIERELEDAAKRDGRRARTESLDLALTLTGLTFRDLVCVAEGAEDSVLGRGPHARARRASPLARPAQAPRGGRALRGPAPGARAQRDGGPGAVGARLPAVAAGRGRLSRLQRRFPHP